VLLLKDPHNRERFVTQNEFTVGSILDRTLSALSHEFGIRVEASESRPLRRFLSNERVVAVLAEFGPNGVRLARACAAAMVPLVVHFHGFDVYRQSTLARYLEGYRTMFEAASAIVAVSTDMERRLVELGAPADRIQCNPCGVEVSMFDQADPERAPPQFLSVGRFVNKKGPLLTILAFQRALEEAPDSRLIMVGDGELLDSSRRLVTCLGLHDRVSFLGSRPHEEVSRLMRGSRAFVQHSVVAHDGDSEGTPVAVLEAGASGLPVISTRHGGITDAVLHNETGFLVEEGDVASMASYMSRVAREPRLAAAVGRRARQHISQNHSMESHIARLWRIIEVAIEDFRPGIAASSRYEISGDAGGDAPTAID
jgi:glycosyltransferase involved in cell wall biosynthesis